jgi:hypothetical protein
MRFENNQLVGPRHIFSRDTKIGTGFTPPLISCSRMQFISGTRTRNLSVAAAGWDRPLKKVNRAQARHRAPLDSHFRAR